MNATAAKTVYTPEDLLTMPDGDYYELVDGQLVERKMSTLSSWVAGELHSQIRNYCQEHPLGWAFPEGTSYQCFPWAPGKVRRADASFIRRERLPADAAVEGHSSTAPDLAVEVVSPNDLAWEIQQKVEEYLEAGVPLVWVVYPNTRAVFVYRGGRPVTWLGPDDELSGEDILPGFRCRVAAIFPPWAGAPAAPVRP